MDHSCIETQTGDSLPSWLRSIPEFDRCVIERAIGAEPAPLCARPALLVIDVLLGFTGTRPLPILDAIAEYPTSCGVYAWEALPRIADCIEAFRSAELPIVWLKAAPRAERSAKSATRRRRRGALPAGLDPDEIHHSVRPELTETVIEKTRASAFFETSLRHYLGTVDADGTVIVGSTTSGCVRASAVDSYSLGYETFVVHDACFDRAQTSHCVSLFDLSSKYATVLDTADLVRQLGNDVRVTFS